MTTLKPKPWDVVAMWIAIGFGAVAIVWTAVRAVLRVIEIVPNREVPVTARFPDTAVTLPFGPNGTDVPAIAEQVILRVSDMPPVTLVSLVLAEIVGALALIIPVVCVCLIIRNLIRGRAFDRSTIGLIGVASLTAPIGWLVASRFSTMGANGGVAVLSGGAVENTGTGVDPVLLFAIAASGSLTVAFQAGHRLQRDTEGLV